MTALGVELQLIANHGACYIFKEQWQWNTMGIWVAGDAVAGVLPDIAANAVAGR